MLNTIVVLGLWVWFMPHIAAGTYSLASAIITIIVVTLFLNLATESAQLALRVGLRLLAIAVFIIIFGGGDPLRMAGLFTSLLPVALVLFALNAVLGGLVRKRDRQR